MNIHSHLPAFFPGVPCEGWTGQTRQLSQGRKKHWHGSGADVGRCSWKAGIHETREIAASPSHIQFKLPLLNVILPAPGVATRGRVSASSDIFIRLPLTPPSSALALARRNLFPKLAEQSPNNPAQQFEVTFHHLSTSLAVNNNDREGFGGEQNSFAGIGA